MPAPSEELDLPAPIDRPDPNTISFDDDADLPAPVEAGFADLPAPANHRDQEDPFSDLSLDDFDDDFAQIFLNQESIEAPILFANFPEVDLPAAKSGPARPSGSPETSWRGGRFAGCRRQKFGSSGPLAPRQLARFADAKGAGRSSGCAFRLRIRRPLRFRV
ncbi:MAG: hypothetical protein R3A47_01100 [Polyangiales bacterium]